VKDRTAHCRQFKQVVLIDVDEGKRAASLAIRRGDTFPDFGDVEVNVARNARRRDKRARQRSLSVARSGVVFPGFSKGTPCVT
jgi:hypothetical protein